MFNEGFLQTIRDELLKIDGDFKEVYLKRSEGFVITKELDSEASDDIYDCGAGVRIKSGDHWSFTHISNGDPDRILSFTKDIASGAETKPSELGKNDKKESETPGNIEEAQTLLSEAAGRTKNKGASSFLGVLRTISEEYSIINSEGTLVSDKKNKTTFYAQTETHHLNNSAKGAECVMEMRSFPDISLKELVEKVADESLRLSKIHLEAKVSPEGEMPVVLASKASGMLIHEAVGHIFEADSHKKRHAVELPGKVISAGCFSLSEKGPVRELASFDDEGNTPSGQTLIESGRVAALLSDMRSSQDLNIPMTGNARRENYRYEPHTRMWRLESPIGKESDDELIAGINIGLYVKRLSDGKVDLIRHSVVFPVAEGYLIRNGKIAEPVKNVEIAAKTPDFLMQIVSVGREREDNWGLCIKKSQTLWVGESIPSLKLAKMQVRAIK
jgi:TldD protein